MSTPAVVPATRVRPALLDAVPAAVLLTVLLVYAFHAAYLLRYPWDWAPDEGLYLDWARRLRDAPSTLYARQLVPFPCFYTPLLFALLAPFMHTASPLMWARLLAIGWTAVTALSMFVLVRRRAPWPLAAIAVALAFAPFDLSFWHLLVRMDGLMIALWMVAAVIVLPAEIAPGADRLGARRLVLGTAAIVAAFLAKQTVVVHAAPLVLCWFLVDRRSAWRLGAAVGGSVVAVVVALEWMTGGAFSYVTRWWGLHPLLFSEVVRNVGNFFERAWPVAAFGAAGGLVAWRCGARPWRDSTLWLWMGGIAIVPAMAKRGALWTYLLPLLCASGVLAGRWWALAIEAGARRSNLLRYGPSLLGAALAAWLAATHEFMLPDVQNTRSCAAFYAFVREASHDGQDRILAARPEYAYFVAGQPVEMEGTSLPVFAARQLPEIDIILRRLRSESYRLVISNPDFYPQEGPYAEALSQHYRAAGGCVLVFVDGATSYTLMVPRASTLAFHPRANTRCWAPRVAGSRP